MLNKSLFFAIVVCSPVVAFSWVDPATPSGALPVSGGTSWNLAFSDEFNGSAVDTTKWNIDNSTKSRAPRYSRGINDWWWKPGNVSVSGGNLILDVIKHDNNTMYCGSINSNNKYEPQYGYFEARVEIADTTKDTHTAFWLQGDNMGNVDGTGNDGAEVDIFESAWFGDYTKSVVHYDGYGGDHRADTRQYTTPGLHSGYHIFGLEWTADSMKIYYDGVLKVTYGGTKVPQVPEFVWLSDGASFGDIGDFQTDPAGWLTSAKFDYVRVWTQGTPGNNPPTANAGSDQSVIDSDENGSESVTLNGQGSSDSDGTIASYVWEENNSQIATGANPTVSLAAGVHTITLTVTDNDGATDTDTVVVTVNTPGIIDDYANADIAGSGTVTGSYIGTQEGDNSYESIQERESGGSTNSRHTYLEHKWTINVTGGNSVTFYVEAHHTANSEGDDFAFAYSTDNVSYTDMVTVTKTSDNDTEQSYVLPASLYGTVYIRVVDTDQTSGNRTKDTIYIDKMYIQSDGGGGNSAPMANAGTNQTVTESDDNGSEDVTLDGSGSSDSDGTIASYEWETNGVQIATGVSPVVSLPVGVHTVDLTVTDNDGATDSDSASVTVDIALAGYDAWKALYGMVGDLSIATNDYDSDGQNNLYEYGLDGDPTNDAVIGIDPVLGAIKQLDGTNWIEYIYLERTNANHGLTYTIEWTVDLVDQPWSTSVDAVVDGTGDASNSDFMTVTNRIPTTGKTQEFLRLNIEQ